MQQGLGYINPQLIQLAETLFNSICKRATHSNTIPLCMKQKGRRESLGRISGKYVMVADALQEVINGSTNKV